jgi:stage II sporulation protein R
MEIQEGIASEIIRFHVIANSDSTEDQALKLKVKDALTNALRPTLQNAKSIEEARFLLMDNLDDLEALSNKVIKANGYTYTASASLERGFFPLKVYGDLSLPPGEYEALRIELGQAAGKNWWCIMYPPLCFVDATYSVVPEPSKNKLKYILSEEEYNSIISQKNIKVKAKFKLLPWLNN